MVRRGNGDYSTTNTLSDDFVSKSVLLGIEWHQWFMML